MLVSGKVLLNDAKKRNYAVPAFGFVNLEGVKAIIKAAENKNSPVILQMTQGGIAYGGLGQLYAIAKSYAESASVPVAIHLDHGRDIELIKEAINLGFTSVMYDGSNLDIDLNCENSKEVKDYLNDKDISLEVEVGVIGGKEDDVEAEANIYAKLEEVVQIYESCKPDAIAVGVGTLHGKYKGKINIKYDLISESFEKTGAAIVLHGASGLTREHVNKSVVAGAAKINFDTELKQALIDGIMDYMEANPKAYDIRKIMEKGIANQVEIAEERIEQCMSASKA